MEVESKDEVRTSSGAGAAEGGHRHRRRLCAGGAVRPAGRRCASGQASLSTCRGKVPNEPPKRPSGKRKRGSETCRGDAGICWRVMGAWWSGNAAPKRGQLARLDMCAANLPLLIGAAAWGRDDAPAAARSPRPPLCLDVSGSSARCLSTTTSDRYPFLSFPFLPGKGGREGGRAMGSEFRGAATAQPPLHAACFRLGVFSGLLPSSLPRVISLLLPCRVARHIVPLLRAQPPVHTGGTLGV